MDKQTDTPASQPAVNQHAAITLQQVCYKQGTETIFNNISLSVPSNSFTALIGPNGGGKTTLLRLLVGLLRPESGSISIFGNPNIQARHLIGYVPQYATLNTDFPATVLETVLMGHARPKGWGTLWKQDTKAKEKAMYLLEALEIKHKCNSPIAALSGGERQRTLVARALMGKPDNPQTPFLLLLDEPTASIDPQGKQCFYEFLQILRNKCTILMVSHDFMLRSPYFSSVYLINKGISELPKGNITLESLESVFGGAHGEGCPVSESLKDAFLA